MLATSKHTLDPALTLFMTVGKLEESFFSDKHKKPITVENLNGCLWGKSIWSDPFYLTSLDGLKQFIHRVTLRLSVDTKGSVALVTLAGEVSYQLTIADHQKQAASC